MHRMTHSYDLKLTFPDSTETIQTNSHFLSTQSHIFYRIISEATSPKTEIEIYDASPSIVFDALQCLHTLGRSLNDVSRAVLIRGFAKNYKMKTLYILCGKFIEENLTAENIGKVHDLACHYKDSGIQYHCWQKIDVSWREIFRNPSFHKCSSATILSCVSRPVYRDMDEFILWNVLCAWSLNKIACDDDSSKQKPLREVVIEYLPYIRFLVMKKEELENVFKTNVLTTNECDALRKAYVKLDVTRLPETLCRETTPRRAMFISKYVSHIDYFYCPKHSLLRWVKAGDTFYAEFIVKRDCFLRGFLLPLRGFTEPLIGMLEMSKVYNAKECQAIDGARKFTLSSHIIKFNPPIFVEASCSIYINVVVIENNLFCQVEPYANCNVGKMTKKVCEETEEWKSFYINDLVIYF